MVSFVQATRLDKDCVDAWCSHSLVTNYREEAGTPTYMRFTGKGSLFRVLHFIALVPVVCCLVAYYELREIDKSPCCQGSNFTHHVDQGSFSKEDLLSIDQRGIKYLIQAEAAEFLKQSQVRVQTTVTTIEYSDLAVSVTFTNGTGLTAQYARLVSGYHKMMMLSSRHPCHSGR